MASIRSLSGADILAHGRPDLQNLQDRSGAQWRRDGKADRLFVPSLRRVPGWPWLAFMFCRIALSRRSVPFALWVASVAAPVGLRERPGMSGGTISSNRALWAWEYARLLAWLDTTKLSAETSNAMRGKRLEALRLAQKSSVASIRLNALVALSNAQYGVGEFGAALAAAEAALQIEPEHSRGLRAKAYALAAHNRFTGARCILQRLRERKPESHELGRKLRALENLPEDLPRPVHTDSSDQAPLLVGVGGGIGDILNSTPLIRNLSRRMGTPVDVLVAADHAGAEFLVRNPEFVNRVFVLSAEVLERRYDTVFLTHCFGPLRFRFNAGRVLASSDWMAFRPGRLHETLFHLEAAKHLLGIDYDEADAGRYFVADLHYMPPAEPLIGIHAGSKAGRWLSKRWPYFGELTTRLCAGGFRVASFGTPDEYVPGTENRTGGSIEEMSRSMMACSHFVSNDSGAMHIANALGIPALAIFAPTDPFTHLPLGPNTKALALEKDCAPCEIRNHPYFAAGACRCVAEISLESVERELMASLAAQAEPLP